MPRLACSAAWCALVGVSWLVGWCTVGVVYGWRAVLLGVRGWGELVSVRRSWLVFGVGGGGRAADGGRTAAAAGVQPKNKNPTQ